MLGLAEREERVPLMAIMLSCCGLLLDESPPRLVAAPPIMVLFPMEKLLRRPEKPICC